jgi:hypothetical protein
VKVQIYIIMKLKQYTLHLRNILFYNTILFQFSRYIMYCKIILNNIAKFKSYNKKTIVKQKIQFLDFVL